MVFKKSIFLTLTGFCVSISGDAFSNSNVGLYLSARVATIQNDYQISAFYYDHVLNNDPENVILMSDALVAFVAYGDIEQAIKIANRIKYAGYTVPLANLILIIEQIRLGDYASIEKVTNNKPVSSDLSYNLLLGWAEFGRGNMNQAISIFDNLKKPKNIHLFGQYHKALALASVGDFEQADRILRGDKNGSLHLHRESILVHGQILNQLGRLKDALNLLDTTLQGTFDEGISILRDRIASGERVEFDYITNAVEGSAEVLYSLGYTLNSEKDRQTSLLYARLANYLRPDYIPNIMLIASLLRKLEQYDLAAEVLTEVPQDHPMFLNAELNRIDVLLEAKKFDAALEALNYLSRIYSTVPRVYMKLGDALRGEEQYDKAIVAYDRAVNLIENKQTNHWFLFYALGICLERVGDWPRAQANFEQALELNPDQSFVLNYFAYTMIEKNINLAQALMMLKKAVAISPNNGYIVDSLGWALYHLGKFYEAVVQMEHAVTLIPDDPTLNDHLGDVYWAVGRTREAKFQWKRALSFKPQAEDALRIQRKLFDGLNATLTIEDDAPINIGDKN